eukprot:310091-Amphidinium_carterae.3
MVLSMYCGGDVPAALPTQNWWVLRWRWRRASRRVRTERVRSLASASRSMIGRYPLGLLWVVPEGRGACEGGSIGRGERCLGLLNVLLRECPVRDVGLCGGLMAQVGYGGAAGRGRCVVRCGGGCGMGVWRGWACSWCWESGGG